MARFAYVSLVVVLACRGADKDSSIDTDPDDTDTTQTDETDTEPGETGETGDTAAPASTPTINELMPEALFAATDGEGEPAGWVELYAPGPGDAPLDGWVLREELSEVEHPLDGHVVPGGGYLLLWADGETKQGADHLSFSLSPEGAWLALLDPAGVTVELLAFGALGPDVAASRIPDGGAVFEIAYGGTPGASNVAMDVEDLMLVDTGTEWRFDDTGSDLGTSWREVDYDDGKWPAGPSPLGYRVNAVETPVGFGKDPEDKYITTYLRTTVEVKGATDLVQVVASVRKDDGVVVYLNGSEIGRLNMPEGKIDYLTPATVPATGGEQDDYFDLRVAPGALVEGTNVLAAEVHQWDPSTNDMIFDLRLSAQRVTLAE